MTRRLSDHERKLWKQVARTVRPARGRKLPDDDPAETPAPVEAVVHKKTSAGATTTTAKASAKPRTPGPLEDISNQRRVRRGQAEIDGRLDLHGYTQDTALRELTTFLLLEREAGSRCVLVITGKGRLGTGVLRSRFLDWIDGPELRPLIAGYSRAHARHGGDGAFYLMIKARRPLASP
jgi:DNA-nicking Smr family endonuclease